MNSKQKARYLGGWLAKEGNFFATNINKNFDTCRAVMLFEKGRGLNYIIILNTRNCGPQKEEHIDFKTPPLEQRITL